MPRQHALLQGPVLHCHRVARKAAVREAGCESTQKGACLQYTRWCPRVLTAVPSTPVVDVFCRMASPHVLTDTPNGEIGWVIGRWGGYIAEYFSE